MSRKTFHLLSLHLFTMTWTIENIHLEVVLHWYHHQKQKLCTGLVCYCLSTRTCNEFVSMFTDKIKNIRQVSISVLRYVLYQCCTILCQQAFSQRFLTAWCKVISKLSTRLFSQALKTAVIKPLSKKNNRDNYRTLSKLLSSSKAIKKKTVSTTERLLFWCFSVRIVTIPQHRLLFLMSSLTST